MRKSVILSVVVLAALIIHCGAWWQSGHLLITQIAIQQLGLTERGRIVLQRAEDLSNALNYLSNEKDQTLLDSSNWIDDTEMQGFIFFTLWKYYDRPLNQDGLYTVLSKVQQQQNLVNAVNRAEKLLVDPDFNGTRKAFRGMFLRMALTYIGDLHAPQQNTNMFNDTYQNGDLGGLKFQVILPDGQNMTLTSYMQSGALYLTPYTDFIQRPLNSSAQELLQEWGKQLVGEYPRSYFNYELSNHNSTYSWSLESYKIAQEFIYPYFRLTNRITQEFLEECQEIIKRRVVLAGYRLADWLERSLLF